MPFATHSIVFAAIAAFMNFTTSVSAAKMQFGVRCQSEFQNNWTPPMDVNGTCDDFISGIQSADPVDFYFNLHGAQPAFYFGDAAETCQWLRRR